MENSNFKNFNYVIIDSSISKHKEVMVTYSYMNKPVRQYLFIKEVKRKNNDYYINEAKKIINKKIESGELAKTSNRLIKKAKHAHPHTGVKKPFLIATSCVLAAGALGAGGYFLGSYLGGGGKSSEGYTVVLSAGKNAHFTREDEYTLMLEGVKDGTKLSEIAGYVQPIEANNMDFADWIITGSEVTFKATDVVKSNLNLTATYTENLASLRANALKDIRDCYDFISQSFPIGSEIHTYLDPLYDEITKGEESPLLKTENKNMVTSLRDFTIKSFIALATSNPSQYSGIASLINDELNAISSEESPARAAAKAAIASAYVTAMSNPTADLGNVKQMNDTLLGALTTYQDDKSARVIEIIASGAMNASVYVYADKQTDLRNSIAPCVNEIVKLSNQEEYADKISLLEDLSSLNKDYYDALSKVTDSNDFESIGIVLKTAQQYYLGSSGTIIEKDVYDLYASSLKSIATVSKDIKVEDLVSDIMNAMNRYSQLAQNYKDDGEKVSFLQNVCKQTIKAISRLSDTNKDLESLIGTLIGAWETNNFDENIRNFINLVMETAANMPEKNVGQSLGATYATLKGNAIMCFSGANNDGGLLATLKFPIEDTTRATRIKIINALNEGYVKSSMYLEYAKSDSSGILKGKYQETVNILLDQNIPAEKFSEVAAKLEAESIIYSSAALNVSKIASTQPDVRSGFGSIMYDIPQALSMLYNSFEPTKAYELALFYANELKNNLWKGLDDFVPYLGVGSPRDYLDKIKNFITILPELAVGQDSQVWMKEVRLYSLVLSQTDFYTVYDKGAYSPSSSVKRIKLFTEGLFSQMRSTDYYNSLYYDEILEIWEHDFFSAITFTSNDEELNAAFAVAKAKADEIAARG